MSFNCPVHGWTNLFQMCPVCAPAHTTVGNTIHIEKPGSYVSMDEHLQSRNFLLQSLADAVERNVKLTAEIERTNKLIKFATGDGWNELPILKDKYAELLTAGRGLVEALEQINRNHAYNSDDGFSHPIARKALEQHGKLFKEGGE